MKLGMSTAVILNHETVQRVERGLRYSTLEGMACGAMQGAGEHFVPAYGIAVGATNREIALLSTVPAFVSAGSQSLSAWLVSVFGRRKTVVVLFTVLSGSIWLPLLGVWFLPSAQRPLGLLLVLAVYAALNGVIPPAWGSIMADLVPSAVRGRYFGLRSRWGTFVSMLAFLAAGGILALLVETPLLGFACVFGLAFLSRMISAVLQTTLVELKHGAKREETIAPTSLLRCLKGTSLGWAMLYIFLLNFVVNLAGPFFAPYMLRELGMDYLTFTILEVVSILGGIWAVTHWGALADRVGNRKVLLTCGLLVGAVPLLWVVSSNPVYLGVAELYGGLVWAGFNLASSNFIYDATTIGNRTSYLSIYRAGAAISSGLGALAGGFLIDHVAYLMGSAILSIFLISGVLRVVTTGLFWRPIREVRRVRRLGATDVFHIMLGGRIVHRPASHGRLHPHFHAHHETDPLSENGGRIEGGAGARAQDGSQKTDQDARSRRSL